jgi:hypothetical protein
METGLIQGRESRQKPKSIKSFDQIIFRHPEPISKPFQGYFQLFGYFLVLFSYFILVSRLSVSSFRFVRFNCRLSAICTSIRYVWPFMKPCNVLIFN